MDQASRPTRADPPIPGQTPVKPPPTTPTLTSPAPGASPRRWTWIAVPLLIVAAGYGGYLIGKPSGTDATASGAGGFGAGAGGFGAGSTRTGGGSGAAGGFGGGAGTFGRGGSGATIAVQATAAKSGTLTTQRSATGVVSASKQSTVAARTSGTVSAINAQVGDSVKAGQTIISLDNTDLSSAVDSAQNALDTARVQLTTQTQTVNGNRAQLAQALASAQAAYSSAQTSYAADQKLYAIGGIARTALDTASSQVQQALSTLTSAQNAVNQNNSAQNGTLLQLRLAVEKAQISLKQAQQAVSNARVVAPFDGTITAVSVAGGEYLNAGTSAFTIVSNNKQVTFSVPPAESTSFTDGREVSFVVGQQTYPLKITQNAGAPTNGNVSLTARFMTGTTPALGTAGSVSYSSAVGKGILIPSTALQADNDQTYVFTIENSKSKLHNVTVIGQAGTQAVVSGIDDGAQVISTPPSGLLDGAAVTTDAAGARAGGNSAAGGAGQGGQFQRGQGAQGTQTQGTQSGAAGQSVNGTQTQGTQTQGTQAAPTIQGGQSGQGAGASSTDTQTTPGTRRFRGQNNNGQSSGQGGSNGQTTPATPSTPATTPGGAP
ncbi:HlyD family efflux transporter periplasmic adaptor subunit [Deinococcus sp. KNUC1210]|uniref:efflux RND transporter periplasmic adaptor subunit n=1 Tax=Deinococcus sp. KNUC1210 TaxID=2917691 RepID=UPI001EEFD851|nr:HlyD family efflux transporter periplasmic adaptor subunit [Deinococcus sp. KNUC1210]ULH15320.1 HlyD family efflux transporter periplasmic adaptor subunit [Deinococcus sp. KNUC1210]